jgi:anti-sigma B factor antagonist
LIDGVAILNAGERLTIANREAFLWQAEEALAATPRIVVDLARTAFVDSSGYGALVTIAKRARSAGGELGLAAARPEIAQMLRILRMEQFFVTYPDTAAALAAAHAASQPSGSRQESDASADIAPVGTDAAGGWQIVRAPRRLDALTAPEFRERCATLLAREARLIVDCSETAFLASAGLAALIALSREARGLGGELRLACLQPDAIQVLRLAKLDGSFAIYRDVIAAGS